MGILVFMLFTGYFFLSAVPVEATTCPTSGDANISGDCFYDVGTYTLDSLTITGTTTVDVGTSTGTAGQVVLIVGGNVSICSTCTIDASGLGSPAGSGTGIGTTSSGAGHGGNGGQGNGGSGGPTYGDPKEPATVGSGGVAAGGGNGGGALKIVATSGTVTLDGVISADGTDDTNGRAGGSGGSVWIQAGTIAGSGTVTANGGDGFDGVTYDGGGGGGGRIAIDYDAGAISNWNLQAYGGSGVGAFTYRNGGAGTIYALDSGATYGDLSVIGNNSVNISNTTQVSATSQDFDDVTISSGARYRIPASTTLDLNGTLTGGGTAKPMIQIESGGTFDTGTTTFTFDDIDVVHLGNIATVTDLRLQDLTYTITTSSATYAAGPIDLTVKIGAAYSFKSLSTLVLDTVTVESGGVLTHAAQSMDTLEHSLKLTAASVDIQSGGSINIDGKGYGYWNWQCSANDWSGGGHGHGGEGGNGSGDVGGSGYGSLDSPTGVGCGGNTVYGGGAAKLEVTGTLNIDGTISANGSNGSSMGPGGASGGSVWLIAGTLSGAGFVNAKGGLGYSTTGGGGAGGRVSYSYVTAAGNITAFSHVDVYGGASSLAVSREDGGAGTVLINDTNDGLDPILYVKGNSLADDQNYTEQPTASIGLSAAYFSDGADWKLLTGYTFTTDYLEGVVDGSINPHITVDAGASVDFSGVSSNLIANIGISNSGIVTLPATMTNNGGDWINTGTITGAVSMTCTGGTCTNDGVIDGGLHDLTIGLLGNWIQIDASDLFSGSDLIVESGGTFTQANTTAIDVGTVWIKSGGTLTHADNSTTKSAMVNLNAVTVTLESGSTVSTNGLGYDCDAGTGAGTGASNAGTGGGGYGGDGGDGESGANAGGAAWGNPDISTETTSPDELGSGAGDNTAVAGCQGGSGGGAIKIVASGVMTINTAVTANGQDGIAQYGGGGSGGSVWLSAGTLNGSTCSIAADGGDANASGNPGGGGGGRIRVNAATDNSNCSSNDTVAAGIGTGTGASGTVGTISYPAGAQPTIDSLTASPGSPTTTTPVTISAQASYASNIKKIELWLDGTIGVDDPVRICNISPQTSPATCSYLAGTLAAGGHTMAVRATGGDDSTKTSTGSFDVAGQTTGNELYLSRISTNATNVTFRLTFTLTGIDTGTLTVTFPGDFTVTSAATDAGSNDCFTNFSYTSTTLVATKTSCSGSVIFGGATVTNPASPGAYTISWTNDNGSGQVYIVDDDQVTVTSDIDPSLSFNVGTSSSCDGTFAGNGGTLALGVMVTGAVTTSDASGVNHICTRVTTNGTGGAVVTARSLYAALTSSSTPADDIASSTATLVAGTEGYGICVGSDGGHTGQDATTPAGASPAATAPFASTCNSTTHNVGGLTVNDQSLWTISGPSQNAFARVFVKAAIASTTPSHGDYTDTLTFIATATY